MDLRLLALGALRQADPSSKVLATQQVAQAWDAGVRADTQINYPQPPGVPGRPQLPRLVPATAVPRRNINTLQGRAALLHAVTHIEFNAINLALDAVWRFTQMPEEFYGDWIRVAAEEAHHFTLLNEHLNTLGHRYGDFDAHDGLWSMTRQTAHDVVARMALVPRTLEARGLDATPAMRERLLRAGDARAADILDIILRDEIGHVAVGNRWYRWLCARDGLHPEQHYAQLCLQYRAPRLKGPFNVQARAQAGFTDCEMRTLVEGAATQPLG